MRPITETSRSDPPASIATSPTSSGRRRCIPCGLLGAMVAPSSGAMH